MSSFWFTTKFRKHNVKLVITSWEVSENLQLDNVWLYIRGKKENNVSIKHYKHDFIVFAT